MTRHRRNVIGHCIQNSPIELNPKSGLNLGKRTTFHHSFFSFSSLMVFFIIFVISLPLFVMHQEAFACSVLPIPGAGTGCPEIGNPLDGCIITPKVLLDGNFKNCIKNNGPATNCDSLSPIVMRSAFQSIFQTDKMDPCIRGTNIGTSNCDNTSFQSRKDVVAQPLKLTIVPCLPAPEDNPPSCKPDPDSVITYYKSGPGGPIRICPDPEDRHSGCAKGANNETRMYRVGSEGKLRICPDQTSPVLGECQTGGIQKLIFFSRNPDGSTTRLCGDPLDPTIGKCDKTSGIPILLFYVKGPNGIVSVCPSPTNPTVGKCPPGFWYVPHKYKITPEGLVRICDTSDKEKPSKTEPSKTIDKTTSGVDKIYSLSSKSPSGIPEWGNFETIPQADSNDPLVFSFTGKIDITRNWPKQHESFLTQLDLYNTGENVTLSRTIEKGTMSLILDLNEDGKLSNGKEWLMDPKLNVYEILQLLDSDRNGSFDGGDLYWYFALVKDGSSYFIPEELGIIAFNYDNAKKTTFKDMHPSGVYSDCLYQGIYHYPECVPISDSHFRYVAWNPHGIITTNGTYPSYGVVMGHLE